jgi:hypothetical protein
MVTCFETGDGSRFESQMKTMTMNARTAQVALVIRVVTTASYLVSFMWGPAGRRDDGRIDVAADMESPFDPVLIAIMIEPGSTG